jgi:hypothetical protein
MAVTFPLRFSKQLYCFSKLTQPNRCRCHGSTMAEPLGAAASPWHRLPCVSLKPLLLHFFRLFNKGRRSLKSLQSLMDSLSLTLVWPWASSKACCYMNNTILVCTKSWIHWTIHKLLKLHAVWIDTHFWVVHHLSTDQKIHRILMRDEFLLMQKLQPLATSERGLTIPDSWHWGWHFPQWKWAVVRHCYCLLQKYSNN